MRRRLCTRLVVISRPAAPRARRAGERPRGRSRGGSRRRGTRRAETPSARHLLPTRARRPAAPAAARDAIVPTPSPRAPSTCADALDLGGQVELVGHPTRRLVDAGRSFRRRQVDALRRSVGQRRDRGAVGGTQRQSVATGVQPPAARRDRAATRRRRPRAARPPRHASPRQLDARCGCGGPPPRESWPSGARGSPIPAASTSARAACVEETRLSCVCSRSLHWYTRSSGAAAAPAAAGHSGRRRRHLDLAAHVDEPPSSSAGGSAEPSIDVTFRSASRSIFSGGRRDPVTTLGAVEPTTQARPGSTPARLVPPPPSGWSTSRPRRRHKSAAAETTARPAAGVRASCAVVTRQQPGRAGAAKRKRRTHEEGHRGACDSPRGQSSTDEVSLGSLWPARRAAILCRSSGYVARPPRASPW